MMEKRFQSQKIEKLSGKTVEQIIGEQPVQQKFQFPVGTKYMWQDKEWFVKRAWVDNGSQFRYVQSHTTGEEQYMELHTLQKDADSGGMILLELTEKDRLMIKAQQPR